MTEKKDIPDTEVAPIAARDEHTLRLVSLRHSGTGKEIWLNVSTIKGLRLTVIDGVELPEDAEVAETFVTMVGEPNGIKVNGRPIDVLNKIRDSSIYI